MSLSKWCQRF